jgi:thiol-disulfide isomerase/thioredoxin
MKIDRQWATVGIAFGLILGLIALGWLARDRFAPIGMGSAAPNYTAVDMEGNRVSLDDLRGEVILLNIWATWCLPCREEMPSMQRLHERLGPEGLRIVAVSVDAELGRVDRSGNRGGDVGGFVHEYQLTFPIWLDPTGEIQRTYRATGVPESFLIDRNGVIITKVIGPDEWDSEANIELIRRLLEG